MPINEPLNSTRRTFTSRHDFSYFEAARQMDFQCRPVLHFHRMFILRLTKLLGQLDLLDLNGETQLLSLLPLVHQQDRPRMAGADWLRSIHRLIPQILMISESQPVAPVLFLHHALRAPDKINK
jgi:hypothetical protein